MRSCAALISAAELALLATVRISVKNILGGLWQLIAFRALHSAMASLVLLPLPEPGEHLVGLTRSIGLRSQN